MYLIHILCQLKHMRTFSSTNNRVTQCRSVRKRKRENLYRSVKSYSVELKCVQFVCCTQRERERYKQKWKRAKFMQKKNEKRMEQKPTNTEHLSYMQNSDTNNPKTDFLNLIPNFTRFSASNTHALLCRLCSVHVFTLLAMPAHSIYYSTINGPNMISIYLKGMHFWHFFFFQYIKSFLSLSRSLPLEW